MHNGYLSDEIIDDVQLGLMLETIVNDFHIYDGSFRAKTIANVSDH